MGTKLSDNLNIGVMDSGQTIKIGKKGDITFLTREEFIKMIVWGFKEMRSEVEHIIASDLHNEEDKLNV